MILKGSSAITDTFIGPRTEKLFKGHLLLQEFLCGLLKTIDTTAAKINSFFTELAVEKCQ